jgi:hypothetical protein
MRWLKIKGKKAEMDGLRVLMAVLIFSVGVFCGLVIERGHTTKIGDGECREGGVVVPLAVEQTVACYKGCQFATQQTLGLLPERLSDDQAVTGKLYDACVGECEYRYSDTR